MMRSVPLVGAVTTRDPVAFSSSTAVAQTLTGGKLIITAEQGMFAESSTRSAASGTRNIRDRRQRGPPRRSFHVDSETLSAREQACSGEEFIFAAAGY